MEGKSNSSFRDFLNTPRREDPNATPSRFAAPLSRPKRRYNIENENENKKVRKENKEGENGREKSEKLEGNNNNSSQYRDRAKERREGMVEDEKISELDMYDTLTKPSSMEEEQDSNFVGPSFPFLPKDSNSSQILPGSDSSDEYEAYSSSSEEEKKEEEKEEKLEMKSEMAKSLFQMFCTPKSIPRIETFLPARTSFVFDLDGTMEVPSVLKRSKEDCPPIVEAMLFSPQPSILSDMKSIFHSVRELGGSLTQYRKKFKKDSNKPNSSVSQSNLEPGKQETIPQKPIIADDDEDIFEDAGRDYVPVLPKSNPEKEQTAPKVTLFAKEIEKDEKIAESESSQLTQSIREQINALSNVQKKKEREKRMNESNEFDEYGILLPGGETTFGVSDPRLLVDDEKGKRKSKGNKKSSNAPKNPDRKIDSDLSKITKIMDSKKS